MKAVSLQAEQGGNGRWKREKRRRKKKRTESDCAPERGDFFNLAWCKLLQGKFRPCQIKALRKVKPKTNDACIDCKICVEVCPMGSVDPEDVRLFTGICIKCGACIKKCPVSARYYDDKEYLYHQHELEEEFARRAEPETFL